MYVYTVTVYYTCTVDSRTDPKSGTVFFSFHFHASTHHCRYYCLFLAVNYKNTLPSSPSSPIVLVHLPRPTSSGHQRPHLPWIIRSDSSDHAVGAVLFQEYSPSPDTIVHQLIAFASHKYSGAAVNWDTFKQEAYALYFAVTQFSYYLRGKEFVIETDHRNLIWMKISLVPIIIRWRVLLQSYNFQIRHIPGKDNTVADWLSRMYPLPEIPLSALHTLHSVKDMFSAVHGGHSLHHDGKRTYLALCARYPGHGIPLRKVQDMVAECPICQKDRLPFQPLPHASTKQTLTQHIRTIGMDHVSVTPHDEDGYVGLLLLVELDTKSSKADPVRDYSASTVATVLFRHYCTFGTYTSILSNPGSAFMADVVHQLNQ